MPFGAQWADSALYGRQTPTKNRRHARQVVGRESENRLCPDLRQTDKTRLAQTTDCLAPTEDLFDQFAFLQAHLVALVARRSGIDGAVFLLRDVRCDLQFAQLFDELGGVIALVGTQRRTGFRHAPLCHRQRRVTLRRAGRQRRFCIPEFNSLISFFPIFGLRSQHSCGFRPLR